MTSALAPDPLLEAVEAARGSWTDLARGHTVEASELRRVVDDMEKGLREAGLEPGDRVATVVGNGPLFVAALAAVLRAGGSPILLHFETPAAEVARHAASYGAAFALTDELTPNDLGAAGFDPTAFSASAWAAGAWGRSRDLPDVPAGARVEAVPLHPTSGTTGRPKLAARPGAAAVAEARHYIDTIGIDHEDTVLCAIPMSHAYGFGMCAMVPLLSGAHLVTMRRFNAARALQAIGDHDVTVYPAVPVALDLLLFEGVEAASAPRRCITSAGAPLPERTARLVRDRWGVSVRPLYGTTETGGISVAGPDRAESAIRSVGPPMEGVSIDLRPVGEDSGTPDTEARSLWVRSSSMMAGYLGPDGIDDSMVADGWFSTGDLATLDEAGDIHLHGRASELINVFGMKVLPSEVEEAIALMPEVTEVKVYSARNRWGSNSVKAAVVGRGGLDAKAVKAHCKSHLAPYKRPEQVVLLDELPKTPSGKVVVARLP